MHSDLDAFITRNAEWVVEGCDGDLIERLLPHCTELLFLNPGAETCIASPLEPLADHARGFIGLATQQAMALGAAPRDGLTAE